MGKNNKTKYEDVKVKKGLDMEKEVEDVSTDRKKLETIVDVNPKKAKKGLASRLLTGVLGPEGLPGIGSYVSEEIIVPAIKNIIVDAVTSGINMVIYGSKSTPNSPRKYTGGRYYGGGYIGNTRPTTNYSHRYSSSRLEPEETTYTKGGGRYGVEEYVIPERVKAAVVLESLTEHANMYGTVSVADYYDLIGANSEYTDNNFGWTLDSVTQANIRPVRGGFVIRFPMVEVI